MTVIGSLVVLAASLLSVLERGQLSGGLVGLSISTSLGVTGTMNGIVRLMTELENQVVSIERVVEYSKVEQEVSFFTYNTYKILFMN